MSAGGRLHGPVRGVISAAETRQHWQIAALLFAGGGLAAIPADALADPAQPATIYLLPLLALVSGLICWLLAGRLEHGWLHLVAAVASIEVALTVWLAGRVFDTYFIFVAIFVAYAFHDRRATILHLGFTSLLVFAPVAYDPDAAREGLINGIVLVPSLALAAAVVVLLRERLAASEWEYRQLSERDPLTGVGNYRMLTERLPGDLARHGRHGGKLALVVIDLDAFKHVNDVHGHQRGDEVLSQVGARLTGCVRASDTVIRHGGDEFVVIAPETGRTDAEQLGGRLCDALAGIAVDGHRLGASAGCAIYPDDGEGLQRLLNVADARLREDKALKRRRQDRPAGTT